MKPKCSNCGCPLTDDNNSYEDDICDDCFEDSQDEMDEEDE
jgi:hypothetical protein